MLELWAGWTLGNLSPNKKAKSGQAVVNMVVGGSSNASTSGATKGVPRKHNTSTPFELWKGRKPSLKYFRVWGCLAKVLVPKHKRKKLGPKTVNAVFLGYVETSYTLSSNSLTHEESNEPRRSERARVVKNFGSDFVTYNIRDDPVT
ncbi:hypothetical protein Sango_2084100 [Sesamum angolense]|uniref:Retroviral polymerase SH3-like domain-containing protein n=1 Tax=Sesamum angolense TaxID=2727404 RepID=A0AAE1WBA8_9LAMI|nr:hypothetical protein Sango_2084100 [Sesamum angolense]